MSLAECTARSMRPSEQRFLDLLGEQALAAHLRQRPVLDRVAGGADDNELDRRLDRPPAPRPAARARCAPAPAPAGCRACRCARGRWIASYDLSMLRASFSAPVRVKGRPGERNDRPRHRDDLRRDRRGGGRAFRGRPRQDPVQCRAQPGRANTPLSAAWCPRSPPAPMSRRSTSSSPSAMSEAERTYDDHRRRRRRRRPGPDRRRHRRADHGEGDRAGQARSR